MRLFFLFISLLFFLESCSTVKYTIVTPAIINRPVRPKYKLLDESLSICSETNVLTLVDNTINMDRYTKQLLLIIEYYESEIKKLKKFPKK